MHRLGHLPMSSWGWAHQSVNLYHYYTARDSTYCNQPARLLNPTSLRPPKGARLCDHCRVLNPADLQMKIAKLN